MVQKLGWWRDDLEPFWMKNGRDEWENNSRPWMKKKYMDNLSGTSYDFQNYKYFHSYCLTVLSEPPKMRTIYGKCPYIGARTPVWLQTGSITWNPFPTIIIPLHIREVKSVTRVRKIEEDFFEGSCRWTMCFPHCIFQDECAELKKNISEKLHIYLRVQGVTGIVNRLFLKNGWSYLHNTGKS